MRAKLEMKPWVHTDKSRLSSAKERHYNASICLRQKSAAPLGLIYDFTANQLLCCFDALTLIYARITRSIETIALYGIRYVIFDIQAPSFTQVNSLHLQSQCLAKAAFCKAPQKNK